MTHQLDCDQGQQIAQHLLLTPVPAVWTWAEAAGPRCADLVCSLCLGLALRPWPIGLGCCLSVPWYAVPAAAACLNQHSSSMGMASGMTPGAAALVVTLMHAVW